uniref:Methylmalonyl-CoA epimerase, mitochondrial n=1 Tax=Rhipicephalus zambeziensis TaxID=60191 RepID=A0A224YYS2_9ACAR
MMQSFLGAFVRAAGRPVVRSLQTSSITRQKWKILKLNHVAMATLQLEKVASFYRDTLGLKVSEPVPQNEHGVTTVFVDVGNTKFELLLPLGDKSPIANFLEKNKGGGTHHVCLEVDDIEAAVADLKQKGIRMLAEKTRIGAHGKPVMFLHPKDCGGVLVELEQA